MSDLNTLWILLGGFMLAALVSVGFSAWAWIVGPAIKHLGRKWEEGKYQAYEAHRQSLQREYQRGVDDALDGRVRREPVTPAASKTSTGTATVPLGKFSITGREIH